MSDVKLSGVIPGITSFGRWKNDHMDNDIAKQ